MHFIKFYFRVSLSSIFILGIDYITFFLGQIRKNVKTDDILLKISLIVPCYIDRYPEFKLFKKFHAYIHTVYIHVYKKNKIRKYESKCIFLLHN